MRKIVLGLVAAATVAAPIVTATAANAYTVNPDGSTHVTKAEVQSSAAFKWNNPDFDSHVVKGGAGGKDITFTGATTKTFDNVLTCKADAGDKAGLVEHVSSTTKGTGTLTAVQTLSDNGKQVNGWDITGVKSATGSNDLLPVLTRSFTLCLPDKPLSEMTPTEMNRQATWTIDNVGTATVDGGDLTATSNTGEQHVLSVTPTV